VIGPYTVDFLWPERRLIVEVDGWDTHRHRSSFEGDRARDVQLKLLGYDVLRFTWRQLQHEPAGVIAALRAFLIS
jgi:very-short-patch-repair endonuclease